MEKDIGTMIFDKLMFDINQGMYKENDKFPSENEIADIYHVPRIIARKVYEQLENLGYIYQ